MRKLSLLIAIMMAAVFTVDAHRNNYQQNSKLKIRLWNNAKFKVVLDHHPYQKTSEFGVRNIESGMHALKIIRTKRNRHNNGVFTQVLYKGTIKIPRNAKVSAIVTPNKRLKLKITKNRKNNHHNHGNGYGNNQAGYYGHSDFDNDFWGDGSCGNGNSFNGHGNDFHNNDNYYGMDDERFANLMRSIDNVNFDTGKLSIAKQALKRNQLNSNQVSQIMSLLSFESNRLKFAMAAYRDTVDKENYFMVNEEFTFGSSSDKLNEYINIYG